MRKIMVALALLGVGMFWEQPQATAADCVIVGVDSEPPKDSDYSLRMQYRVHRHRSRR